MVDCVLGSVMFSNASHEEKVPPLVEGLAWGSGCHTRGTIATKAALFRVLGRPGPEPVATLFATVAGPAGLATAEGAFCRNWRLLRPDWTRLGAAGTPANQATFGRPGTSRGDSVWAFPQVRLAGRSAGPVPWCKVRWAPTGHWSRARRVACSPGTLVLADRGMHGFELRRQAATGAELCWRESTRMRLPRELLLDDGSARSRK
jgi:hypothetical protein